MQSAESHKQRVGLQRWGFEQESCHSSQLGAKTRGKICTASIWKQVFRISRTICLFFQKNCWICFEITSSGFRMTNVNQITAYRHYIFHFPLTFLVEKWPLNEKEIWMYTVYIYQIIGEKRPPYCGRVCYDKIIETIPSAVQSWHAPLGNVREIKSISRCWKCSSPHVKVFIYTDRSWV